MDPVGYHTEPPAIRSLTLPTVLTLLVARVLAASSIAGLLFGPFGLHVPDPATMPSFLTQDVLSLVVAILLPLGSLWTARHGSVRGLLLWMGGLFNVAYTYAYTVLGDHLMPLFPLYASIASASLYSLVYLLINTDAEAVRARFSIHTPVHWAGGFVAGMAVLVAGLWLALIAEDVAPGVAPTRVQLVVFPLDLVVAFPALFWGGVWL